MSEAIINLLSVDSMSTVLATLSGAIQKAFQAEDACYKATEDAKASTVDLILHYTDLGVPAKDIVEQFETTVKDLDLWPFDMKDGVKVYKGIVPARQESLSANIRMRIYNLLESQTLILTEDGFVRTHLVNGRHYIMNEANTDKDGNYTVGKRKGGEKSIKDSKPQSRAPQTPESTATPTRNTGDRESAEDKQADTEVQTSENARNAREALDRIAQSFGNVMQPLDMGIRPLLEANRANMARSEWGKKFIAEMDGLVEQLESNMLDHADVLNIKMKDGKYIIKAS